MTYLIGLLLNELLLEKPVLSEKKPWYFRRWDLHVIGVEDNLEIHHKKRNCNCIW